ncbi:MAG: UvrD-helicase domain-containing protein, partial [bacterium]|nr:UvrD-helicase domain-containing protein [bacterium]
MITQSSAGSGKTYNLALRFLQTLLHRNCRIGNILAITFTNKASAEMRNRILEWMKRILLNLPLNSSRPETLLIDILRKDLDLFTLSGPGPVRLKAFENDSLDSILSRIRLNFEHLLKHYSDFKVSTIDSFNTFIVKSVCFKLGLDPEFEILLDHSRYMDYALKELFQDIMDDPVTRSDFDEFIRVYFQISPRSLKWDSRSILDRTISFIWNKEMEKGKVVADHTGKISLTGLREKIITAVKKIHQNLTTEKTVKPDARFMKALENVHGTGPFMPEKLKTWISREFRHQGSGAPLLNKGSALPDQEVIASFASLKNLMAEYYTEKAGQMVSSVIKVYRKFIEKLDRITRRNRVVLISELNSLLRKILNHEEQVIPEIYYYLAERYNHFLIDEFQDTNTLQWSDLELLITEEFSRGGSLFLVGDQKQSIFRWRGGNSELVRTITDRFRNKEYPVEHLYQLNLEENFRSDEEIVLFNNRIFRYENLLDWVREELDAVKDDSFINPFLETYRNSGQKHIVAGKGKGYIYAEQLIHREEDER